MIVSQTEIVEPNLESIRQTLDLVCAPGKVHEVRIVGHDPFGTIAGFYDDLKIMANHVYKLTTGTATIAGRYKPENAGPPSSVFVTLNPVSPIKLATTGMCNAYKVIPAKKSKGKGDEVVDGWLTSDADIVRRHRLPLDFDPWRDGRAISSTEAGHSNAVQRASDVYGYLDALGFPRGLRASSGNGGHLLYGIDLPNDDETTTLVKSFLKAIAGRFGDNARIVKGVIDESMIDIDEKVFNASRIYTIYGTWKRKGSDLSTDRPDCPARPHRLAKILESPSHLEVTQIDLIQRVIDECVPVNKVTVTMDGDFNNVEDTPGAEPDPDKQAVYDDFKTACLSGQLKDDDDWYKAYKGNLRTLDVQALWKSKGLTCEPQGEGKPYKVQCPFHDRHSDDSLGGTILFHKPGKFPHFQCDRTACRDEFGKGNRSSLKNVLAWFGADLVNAHCSEHYEGKDTDNKDKVRKSPVLLSVSEARVAAGQEVIDPVWGGIQAGMLCLLSGLPNSGKTKIVHTMTANTATGKNELFGLPLSPMKYLSIDPENRLSNTLKWYDKVLGDGSSKLDAVLSFVSCDSLPDTLDADYVNEVIEAGRKVHGDDAKLCVVIDTFRAAYIGDKDYDERNEKYIQNKLKALKLLANRTGVVILVLHHHGWSDERSSGSTAWWGVPDAVFSYHRKFEEEQGKLVRIRVRGNDEELFPTLMIGLGDNGLLVSHGTSTEAKQDAKQSKALTATAKFLKLFPAVSPGLNHAEIAEAWGKQDGSTALPSLRSVKDRALEVYNAGYLSRVGTGVKGDPYRYWVSVKGGALLIGEAVKANSGLGNSGGFGRDSGDRPNCGRNDDVVGSGIFGHSGGDPYRSPPECPNTTSEKEGKNKPPPDNLLNNGVRPNPPESQLVQPLNLDDEPGVQVDPENDDDSKDEPRIKDDAMYTPAERDDDDMTNEPKQDGTPITPAPPNFPASTGFNWADEPTTEKDRLFKARFEAALKKIKAA
jgi:hypothetical protein